MLFNVILFFVPHGGEQIRAKVAPDANYWPIQALPLDHHALPRHIGWMLLPPALLINVLGGTAAILLGAKVAATLVLLRRDKASWFESRWTASLWWATKITPVLAVPCLVAMALIQNRLADARAYGVVMAFVLVAVPLMVWRQLRRGFSE